MILRDVREEDLRLLLNFMYQGEVQVSPDLWRETHKPPKKGIADKNLSVQEKPNGMEIARLTKSASAPSFVRLRPYRSRVWQTTLSKNNAKKLPL